MLKLWKFLYRVLKKGKRTKNEEDKKTVYLSSSEPVFFCYFNYIECSKKKLEI